MPRFVFVASLAAVALLAAGLALAATKSATLTPPPDYTGGGWTITLTGNSGPGATSTQWCATTYACAHDGASGVDDCASHTACTAAPPADITAFVNNRLSA